MRSIPFFHITRVLFSLDLPSVYLVTEINQGIRSRKASGKTKNYLFYQIKVSIWSFISQLQAHSLWRQFNIHQAFLKLSSSVSFEARSGSSSWSNDINRRQVYPALLRRLQHTTNCSCGHRSNLLIHTG